jgi:hypothetical protein
MRTLYYVVEFVGNPLTGLLGFLMFRYPLAWAKMNARLSHKELREFDSPKQLTHCRQVGIFMLIAAAFSFLSLLWVSTLVPLK